MVLIKYDLDNVISQMVNKFLESYQDIEGKCNDLKYFLSAFPQEAQDDFVNNGEKNLLSIHPDVESAEFFIKNGEIEIESEELAIDRFMDLMFFLGSTDLIIYEDIDNVLMNNILVPLSEENPQIVADIYKCKQSGKDCIVDFNGDLTVPLKYIEEFFPL